MENNNPIQNKEAKEWMNKAESDLKHASSSMKLKDYDWVQVASQQAAEKALKSICILKGFGVIKTHNLVVLAKRIKAPENITEKSGLLSSFYRASRYPDESTNGIEEESAHDALFAAEEVLKWCKQQNKT